MSLEAILLKIQGEASKKAEAVIKSADQKKTEALKKHAQELETRHTRDIEKVKTGIAEELRRKEYHVRREAARQILNARRALMDKSIKKAVIRLADSEDSDYLGMISSLEGCDLTGDVIVTISALDESRITPAYLEKHSGRGRNFILSDERHDARGGVIFSSGKISQNGTFPMIAALAHEDIVMELSELIPLEKT